MTPNPPADDLYALPLDEFTEARDELVRRLRDGGDKVAAAAVKSLRKPSLAAWAVNQLARREEESLHRLLSIRDDLAEAPRAQDMRRLSNERRGVMARLVERAGEILEGAGHSASAATLDSVSKTLQGGSTDEERDRLARGVLDRPLEPSGFEGLEGFEAFAAAAEEEPATPRPSAAARRKAERLASDAEEAEREASELRAEADGAADVARQATQRAEQAATRAEKLRKKADEALDELGS